jgi:hypothetical protein
VYYRAGCGANGVLSRLFDCAGAGPTGDGIDFAKERAKPEGKRVLLLPVRRFVRGRRHCCVVHVALAISHSFHGSVRDGSDRVGDLVHTGFAKAGLSMRRMIKFFFLLSITGTLSMKAEPTNLMFQSAPEQTSLLELYTSEGCSSCPPAEAWFSGLKESPGLWKDFVPVAFHVDYWDRLGWRDPFSDRQFSDRQRAYADLWHSENVYTPEFVFSGKEWTGWTVRKSVPRPSGTRVGVLKVSSTDADRWQAVFQPVNTADGNYEIHAVLLPGGVSSDVKAGENRGRRLNHDFAAVNLATVPMTRSEGMFRGHLVLARPPGMSGGDLAIAIWVTRAGNLEPIQAVGGWITPPAKH